jgi:hypothetical protein
MFLSDELVVIGASANSKNNQSMAEAEKKMFKLCFEKHHAGTSGASIKTSLEFAVKELNKMGFKYYDAKRLVNNN